MKIIITETFNVDFPDKFIKFWIILFFSTFLYSVEFNVLIYFHIYIYIYIERERERESVLVVSLLLFHGISTHGGYLMPNPVKTYVY